MIRTSGLAAALAALAVAGCGSAAKSDKPTPAPSGLAAKAAPPPDATSAAQAVPAQIDDAPAPGTTSAIASKETISVEGKPACAIDVSYAGKPGPQFATWRGEACDHLDIRFVTLGDLARIGQDGKLGEADRDALARLPEGKALYVEGEFASALFPLNEADIVYRVPLAD
jgi:hypothetical protein